MPPGEVRDLDFATDAAKMLQVFADKMFQNQLMMNERRSLCALLTDLIFFGDRIAFSLHRSDVN